MKELLIEVKNLCTYFDTEGGTAKAVDDVSFNIHKGEVLGVVGESGSGKSVTALSIMRLIPNPPGRIVRGSIIYQKRDLISLSYRDMYQIRGKEIAMIFQEPMTSLNPVYSIGTQLRECFQTHENISKKDATNHAIDLLDQVGIPDAKRRLNDFPHQFSGGMRQRVMIAMALAYKPALLIADEPTTALDVTIQAQILQLMLEVKEKNSKSAIMLITHDLAVIAEMCERVIVMYGGRIQEIAEVKDIFNNPQHPYTRKLLQSIPRPEAKVHRLQAIRGMVPNILNMPAGCKFCTRCDEKIDACDSIEPELIEANPNHLVRCHLLNKKG